MTRLENGNERSLPCVGLKEVAGCLRFLSPQTYENVPEQKCDHSYLGKISSVIRIEGPNRFYRPLA